MRRMAAKSIANSDQLGVHIQDACPQGYIAQRTAQPSPAQPSTAQHSIAQHSTARHSTAQHGTAQHRGSSAAQPEYCVLTKLLLPKLQHARASHAILSVCNICNLQQPLVTTADQYCQTFLKKKGNLGPTSDMFLLLCLLVICCRWAAAEHRSCASHNDQLQLQP